jgi:hypothetical protein
MTYLTHSLEREKDGSITKEMYERVLKRLYHTESKEHRIKVLRTAFNLQPHQVKGYDEQPAPGFISPGYAIIVVSSEGRFLSQRYMSRFGEVFAYLQSNAATPLGHPSEQAYLSNEVIGRTPVEYSNEVSNEVFLDRHYLIYGQGNSEEERLNELQMYVKNRLQLIEKHGSDLITDYASSYDLRRMKLLSTPDQVQLIFLFRLPSFRLPSDSVPDVYLTLFNACIWMASRGCISIVLNDGDITVALVDRTLSTKGCPQVRPYDNALKRFMIHTTDPMKQAEAILPFLRKALTTQATHGSIHL